MREHLVLIGDGLALDLRAEPLRGVELRQLPQSTEQAIRGASPDDDLAIGLDPHVRAREQRQVFGLLARRHHGQRGLLARPVRRAQLGERADEAAGRGRRADRRAELHQALVQVTRLRGLRQLGHQLAGFRPQLLHAARRPHVVRDREHAREHARHVAVDERCALAVRDRRDRARRIRTDARHAAQLARGARQRVADGLRTRVQIARSRVVSEPRPGGEDVVERRGGERRHRRKLRHPALPVRDHRRDARLLQHDLADPDRVRIARPPPRQVALDARVVRDDRIGDLASGRTAHAVRIPQ